MKVQGLEIWYTEAVNKDELARLIGEKILSNPNVKKDKGVVSADIIQAVKKKVHKMTIYIGMKE